MKGKRTEEPPRGLRKGRNRDVFTFWSRLFHPPLQRCQLLWACLEPVQPLSCPCHCVRKRCCCEHPHHPFTVPSLAWGALGESLCAKLGLFAFPLLLSVWVEVTWWRRLEEQPVTFPNLACRQERNNADKCNRGGSTRQEEASNGTLAPMFLSFRVACQEVRKRLRATNPPPFPLLPLQRQATCVPTSYGTLPFLAFLSQGFRVLGGARSPSLPPRRSAVCRLSGPRFASFHSKSPESSGFEADVGGPAGTTFSIPLSLLMSSSPIEAGRRLSSVLFTPSEAGVLDVTRGDE